MTKAELVEEVANQTGETIQIPAKKDPKLRPGKGLEGAVE